jgi:ABC-type molybdate transport system substrate-binding protein
MFHLVRMRFLAVVLAFSLTMAPARGANILIASSIVMSAVLFDLTGRFESSSGHKLRFILAPPTTIKSRVESGEAIDVVLLPRGDLEELARDGLLAGSLTPIARGTGPPQDAETITAGISRAAKEPQAGRALIEFLKSPAATTVFNSKGLHAPND